MTKIRMPRRRADLLSRRRLIDFLHAHLDCKLVLISAPAGYGKTSLLADFAYETGLSVCWYTLDPFDRDLRIFVEHLIAAVARQFPSFGAKSSLLLRQLTDLGRQLYLLVTTLVREIYDTISDYFVLVLDDYHTVEDEEKIVEFLDLFTTYMDENCHVMIASRTLPVLPNLSLLLARKQATGLSIDELRFLPEEIQSLAQQNYHLALSPEEAQRLAQQPEGWITGLLLTAVPRWEQTQQPAAVRGRVNLGLYDYLSRQVLDQQPAALQDWLMASSVLDELSPDLCARVLASPSAADWLEQVRTRNLFVTEYEGDGPRLRYHDLFREFLQANLRRKDEARYKALLRRAAQVYAERGEWERAINRYLTLQDYELALDIVVRVANRMYETGRWDTLMRWIDALPEALLAGQPDLAIQRGKIHAERGEHAPALEMYGRAKRAFSARGDSLGIAAVLARESYVLRFQGHYAQAIVRCQEALALATGPADQDRSTQALAYKNMGACLVATGRLTDGLVALQQALRLYEELCDPYNIGTVHHDLGTGHEGVGDLAQAAHHYTTALQQWEQLGNPGPWANTLNSLGVLCYLRGEYDQAIKLLRDALTKAQAAGNLRVEAAVWASLGDVYRESRTYVQAEQAYTDSLQAARRCGEGFVVTYALDGLANVSHQRGERAQAKQLAQEAMALAEQRHSSYEIGLCCATCGLVALQEDDYGVARRHLARAMELFGAGGFKREVARAGLYLAQTAWQCGESQTAVELVERALTISVQ